MKQSALGMSDSRPLPAYRGLVRLIPLLAALSLTLAGCGNNPYPAEEAHSRIVYTALGDDPKRLDPSVSYLVSEGQILSLIYQSFFQYHYLKQSPLTLELALGAEMPTRKPAPAWAMKAGQKVPRRGELWSFRLKRGIRFQDDPCFPGGKGREVVAADIIYSFKRMADPGVPCPVLPFFLDKVVGMQEYNDHQRGRAEKKQPADYNRPMEGLQTDPNDPYVFRILLNQPYPQLRYLMAMNFTAPIPREAVEHYGADFRRHPVGCGPFVLDEWSPKRRLVLKRNPNYREEFYPSEGDPGDREAGLLADAGKRLPMVDGIVYTIMKENLTGWNLFLQGYMDAWSIPKESFSQVVSTQGTLTPEMTAKGMRLGRSNDPNIYYLAFNMRDPTVGGYEPKKRKLRQAISMAIDVQSSIDLFNSGLGRQAQFLIPPGIFGYDEEYQNPYRRFDVAAAKKLLAEAGYPDGIDPKTGQKLAISYDNSAISPAERQHVQFMMKQFDRINVKLVSRSWRPEVWQDRVDKGQFQIIHYGWLADYPDPENFVFLLYGPNRRPGPNSSGYDSPEYNRLFEQMRSIDDGPQRDAIIKRMREVAVEDCPWVFEYHAEGLSLQHGWMQNVKRHPIALDGLKYRRIDVDRRAELRQAWNRPVYWPLVALAALLLVGSLPAMATVRGRQRRRLRRSD
jgi:oligopeptide transport system substrate-binding protein